MSETGADVLPDEGETAAGFSAQTLAYPDRYELSKLGSGKNVRFERAVALEIDGSNRVKRCKASDGYLHETLVDGEWIECGRFQSLNEVLGSDIYSVFHQKMAEKSPEIEESD